MNKTKEIEWCEFCHSMGRKMGSKGKDWSMISGKLACYHCGACEPCRTRKDLNPVVDCINRKK